MIASPGLYSAGCMAPKICAMLPGGMRKNAGLCSSAVIQSPASSSSSSCTSTLPPPVCDQVSRKSRRSRSTYNTSAVLRHVAVATRFAPCAIACSAAGVPAFTTVVDLPSNSSTSPLTRNTVVSAVSPRVNSTWPFW